MKAILFISAPTILLIVGCIIFQLSWPFYILAWSAGNGIGILTFLAWLKLKDSSNEPTIKLSEAKKGNKVWLGRHHTEESKLKMRKPKLK